ncbi:nucleoid-associated protein [Allorhizobium undicola]|uniref:nucleoid-associated protein n=1 Tax=Allorhizobium undicola TaxID=78527 RepID=UPI003D331FA3
MIFENLNISRVIIHQIYKRLEDRQIVQPRYAGSLTVLGNEDSAALQDRFITALGSASRCMEMHITANAAGSALDLARRLADSDDPLFISQSREAADMLARAQTRLNIPGGIVVVISGQVSYPPKRFIGIIKAEPHSGFAFSEDGSLTLEFLRNLVLTPEARLYKIGAFVEVDAHSEEGEGWKAFVYDDLMTAANRDNAAQYFYETFLGCNIPQDSARQTRKFFELTKEFVGKLDIPEHEKLDINTSLYTYLKVDQSPTVDTATFATRYLKGADMRDAYATYMERNDFPNAAISKDLSDLKYQLRRRKVVFNSDLQLSGPAERFAELVTVEPIAGDPAADGTRPEWTRITVRDRIRNEQ